MRFANTVAAVIGYLIVCLWLLGLFGIHDTYIRFGPPAWSAEQKHTCETGRGLSRRFYACTFREWVQQQAAGELT